MSLLDLLLQQVLMQELNIFLHRQKKRLIPLLLPIYIMAYDLMGRNVQQPIHAQPPRPKLEY